MASVKSEDQDRTKSRKARQNLPHQSNAGQTPRSERRGSYFPLLFSLYPHELSAVAPYERCWWFLAPAAAQ